VLPQANNPVFLLCSLWTLWIQIGFGIAPFMCSMILRFLRVYFVLRFKTIISGWKAVLCLLALLSPILLLCVIDTALQVDGPIVNEYGMMACYLMDSAVSANLAIILLYFAAFLVCLFNFSYLTHQVLKANFL